MIHKIKIAVLRGGSGMHRDMSMRSGARILYALSPEKYVVYDVSIGTDGSWYVSGLKVKPEDFLMRIDLIVNALHGEFAENGKIQKMLDDFNIPHTGSSALSTSISTSKNLVKNIYKKEGIKTPYHTLIKEEDYSSDQVRELFKSIPMPCIVKSSRRNIESNIYIVTNANELEQAITNVFDVTDSLIIEDYIEGERVHCGVIGNFRELENYSLLPFSVEMDINKLSQAQKEEIQNFARKAHNVLDLGYYSFSDFVISPKRGIYLLKTNTLPDLSEDSLFVKSFADVGLDFEDFLDHIIQSAYPHYIE